MNERARAAAAEEQRRLDRLRRLIDMNAAVIRSYPLSRAEALAIVRSLRAQVLRLFPDKADTYELIYGRRFRRLIEERFGDQGHARPSAQLPGCVKTPAAPQGD